MDASRQEVVLQDGLAQETVALLRTISTESLSSCHLVDSPMHGLDNSWAERLCDITDAETDDIGFGMHYLEGVHLLGYVGKQVVVLEVQEVDVY